MDIKPIRTEEDHEAALVEIASLMDAEPNTAEDDRLAVLATLIEAYELEHHPLPPPDPIDAILFMMDQKGLSRRDLEPAIGGSGRVSEILNRKRPLTLPMIRALSSLLSLPTDILVRPYETASAA